MGHQPNQTETELMAEEAREEDPIHAEDNVEEVESDEIYVGKVFSNEDEAYEAYNTYALTTGFGVYKGKFTKFRTDGKIIRRQFVCNKKDIKNVINV